MHYPNPPLYGLPLLGNQAGQLSEYLPQLDDMRLDILHGIGPLIQVRLRLVLEQKLLMLSGSAKHSTSRLGWV